MLTDSIKFGILIFPWSIVIVNWNYYKLYLLIEKAEIVKYL